MTGLLVDGMGMVVTVVTGVDGVSKTSFVPLSGIVCVQPLIPTKPDKIRIRSRSGIFMRSPGLSKLLLKYIMIGSALAGNSILNSPKMAYAIIRINARRKIYANGFRKHELLFP
jgi:hypothetical protein